MLIGYLNTGKNSITNQINNNSISSNSYTKNSQIIASQRISPKNQGTTESATKQKPVQNYNNAFQDVITHETDFYTYTVVKSNRPVYLKEQAANSDINTVTGTILPVDNIGSASIAEAQDIVQSLDAYIRSGKIFSDIAANNRKYKNEASTAADKNSGVDINAANGSDIAVADMAATSNIPEANAAGTDETKGLNNKATISDISKAAGNKNKATEDKAWIENYALQNKPTSKKWKGRLGYQFYVTPAVNYRKLTTKTKYSATAFAEGDINNSISQKPGVGIEAGFGLNYAVAKKLQFKGSLQFNYTNYNIAADQTNHPVATNILLNDPASGLSYSSARTTTISNGYNASSALSPVTLHNRTYQISIPLGLAYKISSKNNVDWFAGTSIQPSYIFGGNAHIISSDLKSYISEPSSIRSWNLNLGFETYMNFKMGTYNFQVGPQVRYQVHSTYKATVALIEKPYAVGLKFGLTKGF